jgi:ABC-type bacteriocin/lantibiotic exporter with double-glycine peptidase domain
VHATLTPSLASANFASADLASANLAPTDATADLASADLASTDGAAPRRRFQRLLFAALYAERSALIRLAGMALIGALLGIAVPQVARVAIDEALPTASPRMLWVLSLSLLLVGAHQAWAGWIQDTTAAWLGASVERKALGALLGALLGADPDPLGKRDAGWMSDTLGGASAVVHGSVDTFVALIMQGLFGLACLGWLLATSPAAALLVTLMSLAICAVSWWLVRGEARLARIALDATSVERELLNVLVSSLASLRGLFCSERLAAQWRSSLRQSALAETRQHRAASVRGLVVHGGERLLGVAITLWAVYRCLETGLGVGEMLLAMSLGGGLSAAILELGGSCLEFRALEPQFERMHALLAAGRGDPPVDDDALETDDCVALEGVWYRYGDDTRWVVSDHHWRVPRGAFVRLDSPSGSGKSTLLRLLAGLSSPTRGSVRVFGIDAARTRRRVLYVPQDCHLLEASIGENLRLLSGASSETIERVAALTGLSRLLATLPMGLETLATARGQNLSSGQRQLIVLTAAFASNRPVLLLDESMSQIDEGTRSRFEWQALLQNRTVIAVEHGSAD